MNFDEIIDRNQYPTMKWSQAFLTEHFDNANAIPMAVADMDLKAPPAVINALQKRVAHGIFGYESRPESYFNALEAWYQNRHGWQIERQQIEPCPSILNAVSILINQHSNAGEGIILQPPVFFEFRMVIKSNNRRIVKNPLKLIDGRYHMDFADLKAKAADPNNKLLILCNPHNPVGRVWTKAELEQVATICERHGVFVIADEIHGDFAFPPHRYVPYLTIANGTDQRAAACLSPAKTFNIPGIVDAITIIPDESARQQFHNFAHRYQINKVNVFASQAIEAAFTDGAAWLDALLLYLQGNVALIKKVLAAKDNKLSLIDPEGTFLVWLDFRELGLDAIELAAFLAQAAQIAVSPGYWYGREGAGFARMTIGCPRETVQRALNNLSSAVNTREEK